MGLIFEYGWMDVVVLLLTLAICFVTFFKWSFTHWEKRNIPYLTPSIPWGTLENVFRNPKSFGEATLRQYLESKQNGYKFVGLFGLTTPILMIIDPLLIKHIMSTDFKYFADRGIYYNERDDPLSAHLFSIEGLKWRNLRAKLTPTFTTGKMKMMFNIITECGGQLHDAMEKICVQNKPVDIKDVLARFTTNVIGSAAFGIECNTFANPDSEFRKYGKKVFVVTKLQSVKNLIGFFNHEFGRRLGICSNHKDVSDFFMRVITETVEYRENNSIERNDFMQLLIHLKNGTHAHGHEANEQEHNHDGKSLTLNELAAQAFVFFIAGFETSSTTMTFCLFELAVNPDIQDKLRHEIQEVLRAHGGKLTYEAIADMKYMNKVIDETLRKYPPLPILNRKCLEDYKIPDTDIVIEEGTHLFIPVMGLQHDPEYFPNPEKFDPERFDDENKHNIVPYTYLPFGEGPRNCIGLRFGVMQTKVGLTLLLKNFRFTLNVKTQTPLKMDPSSFIQSTLGDMWLNVEKV